MLEAYSTNISVEGNSAIPFNTIQIKKGCSAELAGPSAIQLNKAGVYMVECNVCISPTATGTVSIQLSKNGVMQPQALSITNGTADSITNIGFVTLVQVKENNNCCNCCTNPTTIQVINESGGTFPIAHIVVTKIC